MGHAFHATFYQLDTKPTGSVATGVAATMLVVGEGAFVHPEMLVEIELDAVVS